MILTHLAFFFLAGAGGDPVVPAAAAAEVGGVGRRRDRRIRVIIDDVIYIGTEEQIEERLRELVAQKVPKPEKKRAKMREVELKREPAPVDIPSTIYMPRLERLVSEARRHDDAFMEAALIRLAHRYMDEDDVEIIALVH